MLKDYSLDGPNSQVAIDLGLVNAQWFSPPIDTGRLNQLQQRTNWHAAVSTVGWLMLLIAFGVLAYWLWFSPWALLAFICYGALYGGAADSRWHEMGHNSAFATPWLNNTVYYLASFMLLREPTVWRLSHTRHHSDTLVVGRDLEIAFKRPTSRLELLKTFAGFGAVGLLKRIWHHARGGRDGEVADFVDEQDWPKVQLEARIFLALLTSVVAAAIIWRSALPLLFVGGPTVYGMWLMVFFGITQHAGLQENVLDHRLNTRTVYMNRLFRFLYLDMNYHIEHHMFPTVPYYNLAKLHDEIKQFLPEPCPNTISAYRELLSTLAHQRVDQSWEQPRPVPQVESSAGMTAVEVSVNVVDGVVEIPVTGLEIGKVRTVKVADKSYALFRLASQEYALTDGLCTHGEVDLSTGSVIDCAVIECPKHNGRFDIRTGQPLSRPVKEPLQVYQLRYEPAKAVVSFKPTG